MGRKKPARLARYEADQARRKAEHAAKVDQLAQRGLPQHWADDRTMRVRLSVDDLVRSLERGVMPSRDVLRRGRVLHVAVPVDRAVATFDKLRGERPLLLRRVHELRTQYILLAQSLGVLGTARRVYGDRLAVRSTLRKRPKLISRLIARLQGRVDANNRWNARQSVALERSGAASFRRGGFRLPRKPCVIVQNTVAYDLKVTIWSPTRKDPMPKQKIIFNVPEERANVATQVRVEYLPSTDKEMNHPALAIRWYTEQIKFLHKLSVEIYGVAWEPLPNEEIGGQPYHVPMPLVTRSWKTEEVESVSFAYDDTTQMHRTDDETYIRHYRWVNIVNADGHDEVVRFPLEKWTRIYSIR